MARKRGRTPRSEEAVQEKSLGKMAAGFQAAHLTMGEGRRVARTTMKGASYTKMEAGGLGVAHTN
jgi:hypothetical protein